MEDLSAKEQLKAERTERLKPWRFPKGKSGNPKGRPPSPTTRIKQIWKENPELFDEWVTEYMEDRNNRKHVVEMVDGKPKQNTESKVEVTLPKPLLANVIPTNDSPEEDTEAEETY